jgi:signal peptidase I
MDPQFSNINQAGYIPNNIIEFYAGFAERFRLRITGASMRPLIDEEDHVVVGTRPKRFRVGDVLVFKKLTQLYVHRLVKIEHQGASRYFITKGDFSLVFDRKFDSRAILGKVIIIEKPTGFALNIDTSLWILLNYFIGSFSFAQGWIYRFFCQIKSTMFCKKRFFILSLFSKLYLSLFTFFLILIKGVLFLLLQQKRFFKIEYLIINMHMLK